VIVTQSKYSLFAEVVAEQVGEREMYLYLRRGKEQVISDRYTK